MVDDLYGLSFSELREKAKDLGIEKVGRITKASLIELIEEALSENEGENKIDSPQREYISRNNNLSMDFFKEDDSNNQQGSDKRYSKLRDAIDDSIEMEGVLQVLPEGFGFMRNDDMKSPDEYVYVSASQVQRFKLISGDKVFGKVRAPKEGEKYYAMLFLEKVNGTDTQELIAKERQAMNAGPGKDMSVYEKSHSGVLELTQEGYGFLRTNNYMPGENDIYVPIPQIRKYRLRSGDLVTGKIRASGENERYDALLYVEKINGRAAESMMGRKNFDRLTPIFPNEQYILETAPNVLSTRILDIFAPIGKGQRGLIVSPPKAGKTILLKQVALALKANYPKTKLIILLIDERPEEVTDIMRSIDTDVVYSTFDQKPNNHIKAAEMVLERAKRLVELGEDVVILMDSITRFARANNLIVPSSGRTLSGGIDPESLYFPKKFFGSARNIEGGGSLTILATALVDTGSRMDDIIYEEFKGTGNMEVHLERELAERRIFPAINIQKSGTRREDLLLSEEVLTAQYKIRGVLSSSGTISFADTVIQNMSKTRSNRQFIDILAKNYAGK